MKPTAEIVTANKKIIAELRAMDTHNRAKKNSHVEYLRQEIREGRWTLTNQGIGVSASGYIVDGGHRLQAIELEGCPPVQFVLVRGIPDVAQKYVDTHARRSMHDVLTLFFDVGISTQVVATLNVLIKAHSKWSIGKPSPDQLIEKFQEYGEQVRRIVSIENSKRISAPVIAAIVEVLHDTGDERAVEFAKQVINGEMLQSGDPAFTLRNYLASTPSSSGNLQMEKYRKAKSAIEAFMEGRRLLRLYATK